MFPPPYLLHSITKRYSNHNAWRTPHAELLFRKNFRIYICFAKMGQQQTKRKKRSCRWDKLLLCQQTPLLYSVDDYDLSLEEVLTNAQINIRKIIEIRRIIDTFYIDIHRRWSIAHMVPIHGLKEFVTTNLLDSLLAADARTLITAKSVNLTWLLLDG